MEDLDAEADGSLAASGALAGGTSSNEEAMTAPGSEPAQALASEPNQAAPHVEADRRSLKSYRRTITRGGGRG